MVGDLDSKTKTAVSGVIAKRAGSITATQATEAVSAASAVIDDVLTKAKAAVTSLAVIASVNM